MERLSRYIHVIDNVIGFDLDDNGEQLDDELVRIYEEVAFWRGFIRWWEAKEGRPATARMREVLAVAEAQKDAALAMKKQGVAGQKRLPEDGIRH